MGNVEISAVVVAPDQTVGSTAAQTRVSKMSARILTIAMVLVSCTDTGPPTSHHTAGAEEQSSAAVLAAEGDADKARIASLERDVAELKAEAQTRTPSVLEERVKQLEIRAYARDPIPSPAAALPSPRAGLSLPSLDAANAGNAIDAN